MKKLTLSLIILLVAVSCSTKQESQQHENTKLGIQAPPIDFSAMDSSVKPQDDFYNYVNGNWMKQTKIPSDQGRWGSFSSLRKVNDSITLAVLADALKKGFPKGSDQEKAASYYASVLDVEARDKQGITPLEPFFDRIEQVQSTEDLNKLSKDWALTRLPKLFGVYSYSDAKNSAFNIAHLTPTSLGMGRDYYQKDDQESKDKLAKYHDYVKAMHQKYLGYSEKDAESKASEIVSFEKELANNMLTLVERRDARKRYNKYAVSDLNDLVPNRDFDAYFSSLGISPDSVVVTDLQYFKKLGELQNNMPVDQVKSFLAWSLLNGSMSLLSTEMEKDKFEFYGKTLGGAETQKPLEERALSAVDDALGEAVGKIYVEYVFPAEAKEEMVTLVDYLKKAFAKHISELSWMTDETKQMAKKKLDKMVVKIGYPDKWEDYSAMNIISPEDGGTYFANTTNAYEWGIKDNLAEEGKPVDRTRWGMSPQTVNAYFNPSFNEIVFPAAILQPPFFNFEADPAINFGGIGAVIGHEISHAFDDSGSRYDADGNISNWWKPSDAEMFKVLGDQLSEQYSKYEPFPNIFVNGDLTLGENIGDLGGVAVAHTALQMYLTDKGGASEKIDNLTPDQRFFISWGTIWRTKAKDEYTKNQIKTDPHSPGFYRAFGPLVNQDAFHTAFNTQPGDKMYKAPEDRIVIW